MVPIVSTHIVSSDHGSYQTLSSCEEFAHLGTWTLATREAHGIESYLLLYHAHPKTRPDRPLLTTFGMGVA